MKLNIIICWNNGDEANPLVAIKIDYEPEFLKIYYEEGGFTRIRLGALRWYSVNEAKD